MEQAKKYPEIDWTNNEHYQLKLAVKQLEDIMERECKRHMMDCHLNFSTHDVIEEAIAALNNELDYEPSDAELIGEPAVTADEMHSTAWRQHQELHS